LNQKPTPTLYIAKEYESWRGLKGFKTSPGSLKPSVKKGLSEYEL